MPCGKVLQTVGAHYLGQKFAKVFDITFMNKQAKPELAYMTCYGVSTRLLAATIAAHGDKSGLVVPAVIAPKQVVVVPILSGKGSEAVAAAAQSVAAALKAAGLRVEYDDSDKGPGDKFFYWEMKGVPVRVEVGKRDLEAGVVTLVRRDTGAKSAVPMGEALAAARATFEAQTADMRAKAIKYFEVRRLPLHVCLIIC